MGLVPLVDNEVIDSWLSEVTSAFGFQHTQNKKDGSGLCLDTIDYLKVMVRREKQLYNH